MGEGAVLVITHWFDPTADHVIEELNRRNVRVLRFDAADFPARLVMTGRLTGDRWHTTLRLDERVLDVAEVTGAYFRRPTVFTTSGLPDEVAPWATAEARAGLGGLLMAQRMWLNHPHRVSYSDYRPVQLAAAVRAGLTVPDTVITNAPGEARAFAERYGEVIYKPMSQARPDGRMVYASVVTPHDLAGADGDRVAGTAHLFQERVVHEHAVRLTVVDSALFAAAIHADSDAAALDWRSDYAALTYEPIGVPDDVRRGVLAIMKELRLRFGAFDFLVTPDGWVYLEVNPNGQWAWIETATGLPIVAAIADALTGGPTT
jgi:ATP-grasp ribosomal peptide maturase